MALPQEMDFSHAVITGNYRQSAIHRIAARELQRYLASLSGNLLHMEERKYPSTYPVAIHLLSEDTGIPLTVELVRMGLFRNRTEAKEQVRRWFGDAWASEDAFLLTAYRRSGRCVLLIIGRQPRGVLYGVYTLLEKLGVGFTLGGDVLPPKRVHLRLAPFTQLWKPAFAIRGSLPWFNFLNSPTTWNIEDYRFFFDQMVKMKANFVGFHSYDFEPFCAYRWEGKLTGGEPLVTSTDYNWGQVRGLTTAEFGFGTGESFEEPRFGSRATLEASNREEAIRRAQKLLADALTYAKKRGLKVALGFELHGDPTDPLTQHHLEARLRALLQQYPVLDYVWLWQAEGLGSGSPLPPPQSRLNALREEWRQHFAYLGDERRIHEATRITAYLLLAHRILKAIAPQKRLVVGGWGGDRWMRFSDFFIGMDRILPKDIIFSALDNIDPAWEPGVAQAYGRLSPQRQRWAIPWFESDGGGLRRDQWAPQCNVHPFSRLLPDALHKGCQGILGIHWRTREVEDVAAFTMRFAWNPQMSEQAFWQDYTRRCFGEKRAAPMARVMQQLDSLGPRWTGGAGQVECGSFQWFSDPARLPSQANLRTLQTVRNTVASLHAQAVHEGVTAYAERLRQLLTTIDWVVAYDRAALALWNIEKRVAEAEWHSNAGRREEAQRIAKESVEDLRDALAQLGRAMQLRQRLLVTRGDWGVLATVNVKAYAAALGLRDRLSTLSGIPIEIPQVTGAAYFAHAQPGTLFFCGEPLTLKVAANFPTGTPPKVELLYRRAGEKRFRTLPMRVVKGHVYRATIPANELAPPGVEYTFHVPGHLNPQPVYGVTVAEPVPLPLSAPLRYATPPPPPVAVRAQSTGAYRVMLRWRDHAGSKGIVAYEVERQQEAGEFVPVARWFTTHLIDEPVMPGNVTYRVRAVDAAGATSEWITAPVRVPVPPPPPVVEGVVAEAGAGKVRLRWLPVQGAIAYLVERRDAPEAPWRQIARVARTLYVDAPLPGQAFTYQIRAIDAGGQLGELGEKAIAQPLPVSSEPVLWLRFDGNTEAAGGYRVRTEGSVSYDTGVDGQAIRLGASGAVVIEPDPRFHLTRELTVSMWVRFDRLTQMPVLLAAGRWEEEGFFLQVLQGKMRFYLGRGNVLDAGEIQPGRWYHLTATYDMAEMRLYLNGDLIATQPMNAPEIARWQGELVIGQYHDRAEVYQVIGLIDEVRLYDRALLPEEVRALYEPYGGK